MGKFLTTILICIAFIFSLSGIKGNILQESSEKIAVSGYAESLSKDNISLNALNNLTICDVLASVSTPLRGISFPKNLKFNKTIQMLSSTNTPLFVRNTKDIYFHRCFVKFSYRYFIYTLRRLII